MSTRRRSQPASTMSGCRCSTRWTERSHEPVPSAMRAWSDASTAPRPDHGPLPQARPFRDSVSSRPTRDVSWCSKGATASRPMRWSFASNRSTPGGHGWAPKVGLPFPAFRGGFTDCSSSRVAGTSLQCDVFSRRYGAAPRGAHDLGSEPTVPVFDAGLEQRTVISSRSRRRVSDDGRWPCRRMRSRGQAARTPANRRRAPPAVLAW
jgi:hypothetical protein